MIDKFFIQTNNTILDFMYEIAKSKEVFSTFSCMEIERYSVCFYATKTEIVFLCIDCWHEEDGTLEFSDKGVGRLTQNLPAKYFRKVLPDGTVSKDRKDRRFSPMMELYGQACEMRKFLALSHQFDLVPAIHLVLLTNSHIVNYQKMVRSWQQDLFGFSILHNVHGLRDLNYLNIPYNNDSSIEGSEYWRKWQIYLKNRGWFDWNDYRYDDWPPPSDKRYKWNGEMGHLISDEFEK